MDDRENSRRVLQQLQTFDEQEQYISLPIPNSYSHSSPISNAMEFNVIKNARVSRGGNCNSFVASSDYSDVPPPEHSFEKSNSKSVSSNEFDEEACLDELLHVGKTKKKIEQLAAMVGVDTREPAIVLTEVVRVLKHLQENQPVLHYYSSA